MQELDSQRIDEFEFTPEQAKELLGNYQKNILSDFENLLLLHQNGELKTLVEKIHAFKGMVSLFAKDTLVQKIASIEREVQTHLVTPPPQGLNVLLHDLQLNVSQLHKEVQSYLQTLA